MGSIHNFLNWINWGGGDVAASQNQKPAVECTHCAARQTTNQIPQTPEICVNDFFFFFFFLHNEFTERSRDVLSLPPYI